MSGGAEPPLRVACLCAAWCDSCRDYRSTFDALATKLGDAARFAWVDTEDSADELGELEIENFPTLVIARGDAVLFLGPVTPQLQTAERLVRSALTGALAPLVPVVPADLPARLRRIAPPEV